MQSYNVYVVEDDPTHMVFMQKALQHLGHTLVGSHYRGPEAVEAMADVRPDVVIADVNLDGGVDGIQVAMAVRQLYGLPTIVMTGDTNLETLKNARDAGVASLLYKPLKVADLQSNLILVMENTRLERQLQARERTYRDLFDNSMAGIFQCTRQGRVVEANRALIEMLGFASREECLERLPNVRDCLYVDAERYDAFLTGLMERGEALDAEFEVYGRDGDVFWVSQQSKVVSEQGEGLVESVLVDITRRKELEESLEAQAALLRQTMDCLQDPLVLTDLEGHVIHANAAAAQAFGQALDQGPLHEALIPATRQRMEAAMAGFGDKPERTQFTAELREGQITHVVTASPYYDPRGRAIGVIYVFTRVTGGPL